MVAESIISDYTNQVTNVMHLSQHCQCAICTVIFINHILLLRISIQTAKEWGHFYFDYVGITEYSRTTHPVCVVPVWAVEG